MRFFAITAALVAVAAAQYPVGESCSAAVTVTVTETLKHTPSAPSVPKPTGPAPYPTTAVNTPLPSTVGTGSVGTGYPVNTPLPSTIGTGSAHPSGTGAYSAMPPQFTGAASGLKVGGALAGVGAVAAFFM